jgi:hypothetical protein
MWSSSSAHFFSYFGPKLWRKCWRFFAQTTASFCKNVIITLVFDKNVIFSPKIDKNRCKFQSQHRPQGSQIFSWSKQSKWENIPLTTKYTKLP